MYEGEKKILPTQAKQSLQSMLYSVHTVVYSDC
jgi:hypothetical protein